MVTIQTSPPIKLDPVVRRKSTIKTIVYTALLVLLIGSLPATAGIATFIFGTLSLILHEFGHYWACRRFGVPIEDIKFTLMGGQVRQKEHADTPTENIAIIASGPLFGLLPVLMIYPLANFTMMGGLTTAYTIVVGLNIFNLLPFSKSDGGLIRNTIVHIITDSRVIPTNTHRVIHWGTTFTQVLVLFFILGGFGYLKKFL